MGAYTVRLPFFCGGYGSRGTGGPRLLQITNYFYVAPPGWRQHGHALFWGGSGSRGAGAPCLLRTPRYIRAALPVGPNTASLIPSFRGGYSGRGTRGSCLLLKKPHQLQNHFLRSLQPPRVSEKRRGDGTRYSNTYGRRLITPDEGRRPRKRLFPLRNSISGGVWRVMGRNSTRFDP